MDLAFFIPLSSPLLVFLCTMRDLFLSCNKGVCFFVPFNNPLMQNYKSSRWCSIKAWGPCNVLSQHSEDIMDNKSQQKSE